MVKNYISTFLLTLQCLLAGSQINAQLQDSWHYPLYLSNMDYWHSRIPVKVENPTSKNFIGEPVDFRIGNGKGQLNLAGKDAGGIRLVDKSGHELLYRISSDSEELITEGPVPDKGVFVLPATVRAGESEIYYIYYDNPATWPAGAALSFHANIINGGFEQESAHQPIGWDLDSHRSDQLVNCCSDSVHTGLRCIWMQGNATHSQRTTQLEQKEIYLRTGVKYRVDAWIRGRALKGQAGLKILIGNEATGEKRGGNTELILNAGDGDYGWKHVSKEFIPALDENRARIEIFLDGTGTAWFDDIGLVCLSPASVKKEILSTQNMDLQKQTRMPDWPNDKQWDIRVPLKIINFSKTVQKGVPVYVRMEQVYNRLHDKMNPAGPVEMDPNLLHNLSSFYNAFLFDDTIPSLTEQTINTYFRSEKKLDEEVSTQDHSIGANDSRNLVSNPELLKGEAGWNRIIPDLPEGAFEQEISGGSEGPFLRMKISGRKKNPLIGWEQQIPIKAGHTYMLALRVRCENLSVERPVSLKFLNASGAVLQTVLHTERIAGNTNWRFLSGICKAPTDAFTASLSLVLTEPGMICYKDIMVMEVIEGFASSMHFDQRNASALNKFIAWEVNPVVKIFQEDLPPSMVSELHSSVAKNESEPVQLALRSPEPMHNLKIKIVPPKNKAGISLNNITVCREGYVPIDYPSNYFEKRVPSWYLKYPAEGIGSDGWAGFWPDPLIPAKSFELEANTTRAFWIEISVPEETEKGDYQGLVQIYENDSLLQEIPWTVQVWNFSLPQKRSFGAAYDLREGEAIPESGLDKYREELPGNMLRNKYWSFMAKHRIYPGEISPAPAVDYHEGRVSIDFTEYDKSASFYFDSLQNPFAYLPVNVFYLFGWEFPPDEKFGEKPYPGDFPYTKADRALLRPEYKKAYQQVLKTFWDHVKQKGWADRFLLYLSDEPDMTGDTSIDMVSQLKALSTMIHEVDRKIPIYVSTWYYRPEWKSYIDVWGVAYNGGDDGFTITSEDFRQIVEAGGRIWFTTDGNFCTETPYLALERLLPYYGYKYGAEAFEFWGANWYTYNPYKIGWHSYIFESQVPGDACWKRYPNGDGYIFYPGLPVGQEELVASIRLKQVREGGEDYEYLILLERLIKASDPVNPDLIQAKKAIQDARNLVTVPCSMGRYSSRILKDPDEILRVRMELGNSIEKLSHP
jgi:hypothetical protein